MLKLAKFKKVDKKGCITKIVFHTNKIYSGSNEVILEVMSYMYLNKDSQGRLTE